jgi:hypothetical protein
MDFLLVYVRIFWSIAMRQAAIGDFRLANNVEIRF